MREDLAVEVHEIKCVETDLDFNLMHRDVFLPSSGEGLKIFDGSLVVDSNDFTLHDETRCIGDNDLWDQGYEVGILFCHEFEMAREYGDFARGG